MMLVRGNHLLAMVSLSSCCTRSPMVDDHIIVVELLGGQVDLIEKVLRELLAAAVLEVARLVPEASRRWHACTTSVVTRKGPSTALQARKRRPRHAGAGARHGALGVAEPAPLVVAVAAGDVVAAAVLLDLGGALRARLGVLEHPLAALHLLHHALAVLLAQRLAPRLVRRAPALCEVGARLQAVPRLPALGTEAVRALAARRQHAAARALLRGVLQRRVLAARAPDDVSHLVEARLEQHPLVALVEGGRQQLLHLRRGRGDAAAGLRAEQRGRRAVSELRLEVAADARAAKGVGAPHEA
mmetsp:Transcript_43683/g.128599  ORF Transcript_43683/g.128599 Transcript_43683/m.128599 type:complete len:300 (-) Transcript_43683:104-1003(-)